MAKRNYSNTAVDTDLASGIGSGDTSLQVSDATGWPAAPFYLVVEPDTADEELILVGGKSGTTFSSLTRGAGGTSAKAHDGGDDVKHVAVAADFDLIWTHSHDGVDDSAQIAHDDLTSVGSDDHHTEDHAARHASGGADAIGTGAIATAQIADNAITSAKVSSGLLHEEVEGYQEVAVVSAFSTTYKDLASIDLTIPAGWSSWNCFVTIHFLVVESDDLDFSAQFVIDGTALQEVTEATQDQNRNLVSMVGFRSGMTTTGARTVSHQFKERLGDILQVEDIAMYARARRTS